MISTAALVIRIFIREMKIFTSRFLFLQRKYDYTYYSITDIFYHSDTKAASFATTKVACRGNNCLACIDFLLCCLYLIKLW